MKLMACRLNLYTQQLIFRHLLAGLLVMAIIFCSSKLTAGAELTPGNQLINSQGLIYSHPDKKFSIYVPADAEILETDSAIDLAMQSRSGWSINIQSSPANHALKLEQMAGHFEAKYVGPDKPWSQKLSGEILDKNSYSGQYEGSGTRIRMIIKRTPLWDYVLMFMAPDDAFIKSAVVFQQVFESFDPLVPADYQGGITGSDGEAIPDERNPEPLPTQLNRFHDPALGYAISYPANWLASKPDAFTVVFSGQVGTDPGYVAVSIRNVAPPPSAPPQGVSEGMLQQLKAQMAYNDANVQHDRSVEIKIGQGDQIIYGMQMISTFKRGGIGFRQWSIVAPRPEVQVIHVWTYTAPLDRFDTYQGIAEKMAGSLIFMSASAQ
ncbi:MAG: hypothetical protein HQ501_08310 [Rhodospirillales bacterium]|nr:hypothetical protein [Rhodospirillales bacterium]